jgi:hypothetical protein
LPYFLEGGVAELLFVGLAFSEGWCASSRWVERRPSSARLDTDAGARVMTSSMPRAFDGAEALDVGVVEDADGLAELAGESEVEVEALPGALAEVVGGEDFCRGARRRESRRRRGQAREDRRRVWRWWR